MINIVSKNNQFVKHLCKLRDSSHYRWEHHQAIIYGEHLVVEAICHGILDSLIINDNANIQHLDIQGVKLYTANSIVLNKISNLDSEISLVGVINFEYKVEPEELYNSDCIILESIQDPGNLGAILRVAKASGFKNIILSNDSVDVYNSKVIRASQGVQFGLNVIYTERLSDFIAKYQGISIATMPNTLHNIYQYNLSQKSILWAFGNEGMGLSDEIASMVDIKLAIPMSGGVESLNVAMASGICLFETYRQRVYK